MNNQVIARYSVCLMNSADPRGPKVGGIETYVRDYIFYHPEDMNLLFVGPDELDDLELGMIHKVEFWGRSFDFLPLYHLSDSTNVYPDSIFHSETFSFASQLMRNWFKLRRILRRGKYSVELRRVEYAPILWLMGIPFIQMVHVWGDKSKPMSSLMGKYWYLRTATECIAAALCKKFYSVNDNMTAMYRRKFKPFARKFDTLTTWANASIFRVMPYAFDGTIHLFYAGRMDKFKRPDIMFRVVERARRHSPHPVRFHYVGDGDPSEFPEFAAISDITVLHGRKPPQELANILGTAHIGILTSEFEGMPCVVMETLATGRPVVALDLPQLEAVIFNEQTGFLIPRGDNQIDTFARRICEIYDLMQQGKITPESVAKAVDSFSPTALLGKIFRDHRSLHGLSTENQAI